MIKHIKKVISITVICVILLSMICISGGGVSAASNSVMRMEAYNYSGYFWRHSNLTAMIASDPAPIYDSYFVERSGLADSNYVSFESVNYPGYYLRHKNFVLYLEKDDSTTSFAQDATFQKVSGLADSSYYSFKSYNYPTYYIRHEAFVLKLTTISTTTDQSDATFKTSTFSSTFSNPRDSSNQRPDPFVYKHTDGYYYGLCTAQDSTGYLPKIEMWKSTSLVNLYTKGTKTTIWTAPSSGWNSSDIWAPELYRINNTWYIYYSGGYRVGVLSNTSSDPSKGTWTDCGMISPDDWAIDGTVFTQNSNSYMIWSHYDSSQGQVLYISKMSSPTALTGSIVQISAPTYSWEQLGGTVNEGPEILQKGSNTYCIYSASSCATQYYCLGQLSISSTADPMVASNWTKLSNPVLQMSSDSGIYGTGHCSFTKSKDGTQDWLVYHATLVASSVYQPRYMCMQQFTWNSDGTPNFWGPCGRYISIPLPSGE